MTYSLKNHDSILINWPAPVRCMHDLNSKPELAAQIASDDYFALLATQLDNISQSLKEKHHSDYLILESSIDDLLYLHKYYAIHKK
ncbi:MAG: hypothetical protein ABIQ89_02370 [Candidatus Saccharimonadales bacterium]